MTMKKWVVGLVMAMVIAITSVEGAIGIDLNPCTLPQCIAACKKVLEEKYQSATCAAGPNGKYCICLG